MSKYLARLRELKSKKPSPHELPKLPKGGLGSLGSDQGDSVLKIFRAPAPEVSRAPAQPDVAPAGRFSDLWATEAEYARALIRYAAQSGWRLVPRAGRLMVAIGDCRTDGDLLGELRAHEAAVMTALAEAPPEPSYDGSARQQEADERNKEAARQGVTDRWCSCGRLAGLARPKGRLEVWLCDRCGRSD